MSKRQMRAFCANPPCKYHSLRARDEEADRMVLQNTWPFAKYVVRRTRIGPNKFLCGKCHSAVTIYLKEVSPDQSGVHPA